jgi:hypothetical protein
VRQPGRSRWLPLESRNGPHHDQQPLTAEWTGLTRAGWWAPGISGLWRWFRNSERENSWASREGELKLVQERTLDRTPQAIVADFVAALGQYMLEKAADELIGGQGHGPPALVLGVLVAEVHVTVVG